MFAARTIGSNGDSVIFFTLAATFEADVHCTASGQEPFRKQKMSANPHRSFRMFAPGIHRSTISACHPLARRAASVRCVGLTGIA
jgi:hypothetical protein